MKMRDFEFLRLEMQESREGCRMDYDRMKESRDAVEHYRELIKKVGIEKASEIVKLGPEKAQELLESKDSSYKPNQKDSEVLKTIEEKWQQFNTDMSQLEKQMEGIDAQVDSINEKIRGFHLVIELLKKNKK